MEEVLDDMGAPYPDGRTVLFLDGKGRRWRMWMVGRLPWPVRLHKYMIDESAKKGTGKRGCFFCPSWGRGGSILIRPSTPGIPSLVSRIL